MIHLTDEIRMALDQALANRIFCALATADAQGMPDVSYRGSVVAWDEEHLVFWERSRGTALENMRENPKVCIMYYNPNNRKFWRFYGRAQLIAEGPERERIMAAIPEAELERDPERTGVAVKVALDMVREGPRVIMQRESR